MLDTILYGVGRIKLSDGLAEELFERFCGI